MRLNAIQRQKWKREKHNSRIQARKKILRVYSLDVVVVVVVVVVEGASRVVVFGEDEKVTLNQSLFLQQSKRCGRILVFCSNV